MNNPRKSEMLNTFNTTTNIPKRVATTGNQINKSQVQNKTARTIEERMDTNNQLETFYLPFMKQVYQDNKDKLEGKIKPPEQLLKKSAIREFSNDLELRRGYEMLKRENQSKDTKIKELVFKSNQLYNKLKVFMKDEQINVDVEGLTDDNDKKIRRLENLLRIKNEEVFFKIKVQAANLLEEFQVDKADITGINQLDSENAIFEFLITKLKLRLKDFKSKERQNTQQLHKDKIKQEKNQETIHYLTETNQILRNSEARAKQKLEDIKGQWQAACEKLSSKEKQLENKENQIFKLKKLYDESQNLVLKASANERLLQNQLEQNKREADLNMKDLRSLLTTYNLEKKKLESYVQEREGLIEEMEIREKYNQEELDKMNREYTRWKERYEWLEKQKQSRVKSYEEELKAISAQYSQYKKKYNSQTQDSLKAQLAQVQRELDNYRISIDKYEQELEYQSQSRMQNEEEYYKRIESLELEYIKKYQNFETAKQAQINEVIKMREETENERLLDLEQKWKLKLQEVEAQSKIKYSQAEKLYMEKFTGLNLEIEEMKDTIIELNNKIEEKDKLITILYPNINAT